MVVPPKASQPSEVRRDDAPPDSESHIKVVQPTPEQPGIAKPYIPKDDPAIPAVVIAEDAQDPPKPKRVATKTVPAKRYTATAPTPEPAVAPLDLPEDFAPKRGGAKVFFAVALGGAIVAVGLWLFMQGRPPTSAEPSKPPDTVAAPKPPEPPAAVAPTPEPPAPNPEPVATPEPSAAPEPEPEPERDAEKPAKPVARPKPKAIARPAPKAPTVAASKPAATQVAAEPAGSPQKPKSGGIVREAPF